MECEPKGCQSERDCARGAFCDFERSEQIADAVASTLLDKEDAEEDEKKEEDAGEKEAEEEEEIVEVEETDEEKEARLKREEAEERKRQEEKERLKEQIASKGECKCPEEFTGNPYIHGCREGKPDKYHNTFCAIKSRFWPHDMTKQ